MLSEPRYYVLMQTGKDGISKFCDTESYLLIKTLKNHERTEILCVNYTQNAEDRASIHIFCLKDRCQNLEGDFTDFAKAVKNRIGVYPEELEIKTSRD